LWAGGYDESVDIADENDEYPFAGYKVLMNSVYNAVMERCPVKVLDIGVGTGTLAFKLYESGNEITGIDFSSEMLNHAREKMPNAQFIEYDFTNGLPCELNDKKFDFIISTYALHHLTDGAKIDFIKTLLTHIDSAGAIIIGDVSFRDRESFDRCRISSADEWDDDEFYSIFTELHDKLSAFCAMTYHQVSHCSGILEIRQSKHVLARQK
jgi:putative AdoMet-dependent methyltransferase